MKLDRYKFRALRESDRQMIYGSLILNCIDYDDNKKMKPKIGGWYDGATFSDFVIPETIGQCTGLKDKNGELIWEGDIIEHHNYPLSKIVYCETLGGYCAEMLFDEEPKEGWDETDLTKKGNHIELFYMDLHEQEMIGNIYENPELLEVNKK